MKYGELKTTVGEYLNKKNLNAMIPSFIRFGQAYLEKELRLESMQATQDLALAAGSQSFLEPDLFLEMGLARFMSDTDQHEKFDPMDKKDWEYFLENKLPSTSAGIPKMYSRINIVETTDVSLPDTGITALSARSFVFERPTDKDYVLQYSFYRREAAFTTDSSTNWWLTNAEEALIYASLVKASIFLANGDPRKDVWATGLGLSIDELEENDRAARRGGHRPSANETY
jgi:hypothetical protein